MAALSALTKNKPELCPEVAEMLVAFTEHWLHHSQHLRCQWTLRQYIGKMKLSSPTLGIRLIAFVFLLSTVLSAQTVTLRLASDLSSKMPSGTQFEAQDSAGKVYHGHLVTHRARSMMRNGSMILVFDDPVRPVTKDREGVYHGGNKIRLLKIGGSLGLAKLADDAVDGAIGATKARYVGAVAAIGFLLITKGEEAKLHAGDTVEVSPSR